jgi:membrane protease YdiL (CAAX protease family)
MTSVPSSPSYQPDGTPPPDESPAGELPQLGLSVWGALFGVLFVAVGSVLISALAGAVIGLAGGDVQTLEDNLPLTIGLTIAVDGVMIAAPVAIVAWMLRARPDPAAFGLRLPRWSAALRSTFMVYAGFWAAALVIALLAGAARDQDIARDIKTEDSTAVIGALIVMTCIIAPLAEEFFFRGFLFRVLWERTNVAVGAVAAGAAFGIVHKPGADWVGTAVLACFGVALCLLLWRTASLLPCIMLHSLHNSISFASTKGLPWWGFLLMIAGCVATTLVIAIMATRRFGGVAAPPVPA